MAHAIAPRALTADEEKFLYNLEVLGMTQLRAAQLAGVASPQDVLRRADVVTARTKLREAVRARAAITKDDVVHGIKDAIDQAVLITDPMAQIAGWREIAKMLGYDAPREVRVTISHDLSMRRRQIAQLPDDALVEMLGADDVIDADFSEVHGP